MEVVFLQGIRLIWLMRITIDLLDIAHLTDGIDINVLALVQYKVERLRMTNFLQQSFRRMG